jgi:succinate dehydrogenase flavin-adding protein (antitoxin of CptAB toxin-antitoxin module)
MSEIEAYCRLVKFRQEQVEDFIIYVERMDTNFMEWVAEEQDSAKSKNPKNTTSPRA